MEEMKKAESELKQKQAKFDRSIDRFINQIEDLKFTLKNLKYDDDKSHFKKDSALNKSIDELDMGTRTYNALKSKQMVTLAEIAREKPSQLLEYSGFGKVALAELSEILEEHSLHFGMDISAHLKESK
ncbi:MAG: DNA-directed RNA polymerase subunit alpha C-terminal domain-containing protein [Candidatus Paceibacterota bacterium]